MPLQTTADSEDAEVDGTAVHRSGGCIATATATAASIESLFSVRAPKRGQGGGGAQGSLLRLKSLTEKILVAVNKDFMSGDER